MNKIEKNHPKDRPHFYLEFIGVTPELHGNGIGSALLQHIVDRADSKMIGVYLECANPKIVPLYERFGFRIEAQQNILNTLKSIQDVRKSNPQSILVIAFLDAKTDELVNIFSSSDNQNQRDAYNLLIEIDPSKREKYARIISN